MKVRVASACTIFCLSAAVTLGGCSKVVKGQRTTTIESEPSGATVLASGVEVGVTPITIRPDDVFPPRIVGFEYRAAGTLSIHKPGCKPFSEQVNDAVLSQDVHVKLQCDPHYRPLAAQAAPASNSAAQAPTPQSKPSIADRLQRLNALRSQGLITADEYQRIRAAILNEL